MKIRKNNSKFPKILLGIVLLCSFFLFSFLFLSGETPENKNDSSIASTPDNQDEQSNPGGKTGPVITPPPIQEANPSHRDNPGEEEETETLPSYPPAGKTVVEWGDFLPENFSYLQTPLPGAGVTTRDSQLPGAPRPYRHGVHEGLDFYSGYCGIQVNFGDPVFAAGPGFVFRIDHDYIEPTLEEREAMLQTCKAGGNTPELILDKLRGRQVWIAHSRGLITRYAHLSKVAEHLQEGDRIEAGDYLGDVGNSGTDEGARGETSGSHLHFEIWLEDSYLGAGLTPQEIRSLWKTLLEKSN